MKGSGWMKNSPIAKAAVKSSDWVLKVSAYMTRDRPKVLAGEWLRLLACTNYM
jgi:hypothetical protein